MNKPTKTWTLLLMSDLVVVGRHWEDASEIIRERWYVAAVDRAGRRFAYHGMELEHEAQERLALLVLDGGVDPMKSDGWNEMYPVYGSLAYQDQEPEIVFAEKQAATLDTGRIIGMRYDTKDRVMA